MNRCRHFQAKKRLAAKILRDLVSLRTIEASYVVPRNLHEARQSNLRSFYYQHHISAQHASFEVLIALDVVPEVPRRPFQELF